VNFIHAKKNKPLRHQDTKNFVEGASIETGVGSISTQEAPSGERAFMRLPLQSFFLLLCPRSFRLAAGLGFVV
jgi:hypothetical protein